jgi:crotonobetainyl-CoA:carnitine CoA-transferase CaiB-like acyl-CoA transferase
MTDSAHQHSLRPLDSITVLDLTRLLPGAIATAYLANFGAEVIKIEQPGAGDPARHLEIGPWLFTHTNRGKKSIALDLKDPRGRGSFLALTEKADVVIESFRPGVMARLGVGYDELSRSNPRLIYVAISGYGQAGPRSKLAGHDINYMGLSGLLELLQPAGVAKPSVPEVQFADILGGSLHAVIGVLLALQARQKTGKGQSVDVSIFDGLSAALALPLAATAAGQSLVRGEELLSGGYACYNVYQCSEGRWIALGALEPKFWANLCRELGVEALIPDQFVQARQHEVKKTLASIFAGRSADDWFATLGDKDCCLTPVRTLAEARSAGDFNDPNLGLAPLLSSTPARLSTPEAPEVNEHSSELLERFGLSP